MMAIVKAEGSITVLTCTARAIVFKVGGTLIYGLLTARLELWDGGFVASRTRSRFDYGLVSSRTAYVTCFNECVHCLVVRWWCFVELEYSGTCTMLSPWHIFMMYKVL